MTRQRAITQADLVTQFLREEALDRLLRDVMSHPAPDTDSQTGPYGPGETATAYALVGDWQD